MLIGFKISQIDQAVRPPLAEADRPLDFRSSFNKLYENNGKHWFCIVKHGIVVFFARLSFMFIEISKIWRRLGRHEDFGYFDPNSQKRAGVPGDYNVYNLNYQVAVDGCCHSPHCGASSRIYSTWGCEIVCLCIRSRCWMPGLVPKPQGLVPIL